MAQTVKCLSAMQETQVRSLGWEDPLEKEMAAHSSILAWKIPWAEELGWLQSMGSQRLPRWHSSKEFACQCRRFKRRSPRVANGNSHLFSNLENSMDRGAWQVTVHGVAKSQT